MEYAKSSSEITQRKVVLDKEIAEKCYMRLSAFEKDMLCLVRGYAQYVIRTNNKFETSPDETRSVLTLYGYISSCYHVVGADAAYIERAARQLIDELILKMAGYYCRNIQEPPSFLTFLSFRIIVDYIRCGILEIPFPIKRYD